MVIPDIKFWDFFKKREGAFSVTEAVALYNICLDAPKGEYIELGSYKLKSASIAAMALKDGTFWLVDPLFRDEKFCEEVMMNIMFKINMVLVGNESLDEIPKHGKYSYVFVDSGDHQSLPMKEVKMLEDSVVKDGIIAFHDVFAQFLQVTEAYEYLLSTGKYEPININWQEIIEYVNENNLEEENVSWHHNELKNPCFVGALRRK